MKPPDSPRVSGLSPRGPAQLRQKALCFRRDFGSSCHLVCRPYPVPSLQPRSKSGTVLPLILLGPRREYTWRPRTAMFPLPAPKSMDPNGPQVQVLPSPPVHAQPLLGLGLCRRAVDKAHSSLAGEEGPETEACTDLGVGLGVLGAGNSEFRYLKSRRGTGANVVYPLASQTSRPIRRGQGRPSVGHGEGCPEQGPWVPTSKGGAVWKCNMHTCSV